MTDTTDADEVGRLLGQFEAEDTAALSDIDDSAKDGIIARLEGADDPRVLPFLLRVIADPGEYDLARVEALKVLELRPRDTEENTARIGSAVARLLDGEPDEDVRQYAAMAAAAYMDRPDVFRAVTAVLADEDGQQSDVVRGNALDAVERMGPSDATASLLRRLAGGGGEISRFAARVLRDWDLSDGPLPAQTAP